MTEFERDLTSLLNRYSMENASNTPDFILAHFLCQCLAAWNEITQRRNNWHGVNLISAPAPPAGLRWSSELPTKPGWYWWQQAEEYMAVVKEVMFHPFHKKMWAGADGPAESIGGRWAGPLQAPEG